MQILSTLLAAASLAAMVEGHGYFTSPKARQPGPLYKSICGEQIYNNMLGSINGNIQGLLQVAKGQPDYTSKCQLWKCKGMKFQDNVANVQSYKAGQTVPLNFAIVAPHTGVANVSIIKTSTNKLISANLKSWDVYASNSVPTVASQESFSIKMPTNLGSQCAKAGDCAIQMFWDARSVDQTYESCIDFKMPAASAKRGEEDGESMRPHPRDFSPRPAAE